MQGDGHEAWLHRNRDLAGRGSDPWARRAGLLILLAFVLAAALGVFGQGTKDSSATAPTATLDLKAPDRARGGDIFQARIEVRAGREIKQPSLVLDPGWAEEMAINTIEPSPTEEASDDGKLSFELGPIAAGKTFVLYMQFQVNPTNVGRRSQDVALFDGQTHLLTLSRDVTIYP